MYAEAQSLVYADVRHGFLEALVYAGTPKKWVLYAEDLRENTPTFQSGLTNTYLAWLSG